MSSDSLSSYSSFDSESSDYYIDKEDQEDDTAWQSRLQERSGPAESEGSFDNLEMAYADEPLADAKWLEQYEKEQEDNAILERQLENRLNGTEEVSSWCSCQCCDRDLLQNLSECYCCKKIEGCEEALNSEIVLQEIEPGTELNCITAHPGLNPVCLQKWSLRMAADRFRTKSKKKYRQTGSEEIFLRSVAYREFSRLVYGYLGNRRIPLPACAYTAIRKQFPACDEESFTGFELDEET